MKEKSRLDVNSDGSVVLKADNMAILDLRKLLVLQDKYTTLQCECKRLADYVINLTHSREAMAIRFDNEYLRMAGDMLFEFFGHLPKTGLEEIIKELKK